MIRDTTSPIKPKEKTGPGKVKKLATFIQRLEKSPVKPAQSQEADSPTKFKKSEKKAKNTNKNV